MTDATSSSAVPAGWYPDPRDPAQTRFWTGTAWSSLAQVVTPGIPPRVPKSTEVMTPWIWLITLVPLLTVIGAAFYDFSGYFTRALDFETGVDAAYLGLQALGFVVYGVSVFLAFLDRRVLLSRAIANPFHWAWAFLGAGVYVVGRTVIVMRRSQHGLTPVVVMILVVVTAFVVIGVKLSQLFAEIIPAL